MNRDRKGHYIMIKELVPQEDIAILNAYAWIKTAAQYMKVKLIELKGEIDLQYSWRVQHLVEQ